VYRAAVVLARLVILQVQKGLVTNKTVAQVVVV
jgi:hypothetical protein